MRVTEEMVRRAIAEAICAKWQWSEEPVARRMLEAALADVPEPDRGAEARANLAEATITASQNMRMRLDTRIIGLEARVKELEAQLAQVRASADPEADKP